MLKHEFVCEGIVTIIHVANQRRINDVPVALQLCAKQLWIMNYDFHDWLLSMYGARSRRVAEEWDVLLRMPVFCIVKYVLLSPSRLDSDT